MRAVALRERIENLLQLGDDELGSARAAELEDAIQTGLAAIYSAELWIAHVQRARDEAAGSDPERAAELTRELGAAQAAVDGARTQVARLHERARRLGVGDPR
jgi:hypothetical protein